MLFTRLDGTRRSHKRTFSCKFFKSLLPFSSCLPFFFCFFRFCRSQFEARMRRQENRCKARKDGKRKGEEKKEWKIDITPVDIIGKPCTYYGKNALKKNENDNYNYKRRTSFARDTGCNRQTKFLNVTTIFAERITQKRLPTANSNK